MAKLSEVGRDETVVLPSHSQPPSTITTDHGIRLTVLPGNVAQRWLGCMLTAYGSEVKVKVKAWTPCGGPILGAGGEPKETIFTNPYLQIASL